MKRPILLLLLALVTMTAVACGFGPAASPAPSLTGKTYLSTDVQGVALVPGSRIQLTFTSDGVNANGGCNSLSGPYMISSDRFKVT